MAYAYFYFLSARLLFTDKRRFSTWCLPNNLTGFSKIDRIEHFYLLIIAGNTLSFKTFLFTDTRFLDFEGFTDTCIPDGAIDEQSKRVWVHCKDRGIRKRSSINALTGAEREIGNYSRQFHLQEIPRLHSC